MSILDKLTAIQHHHQSRLCVGLDTDITKIPNHLRDSDKGLLKFNLGIIEATAAHASAYKFNFAFYEQYGKRGMKVLRKSLEAVPKGIITIADAKRGDIGNTSTAYAKAVFEDMNFDAITVSPYMGRDSVEPFLQYEDKLVFVLALTSNPGSTDFQHIISDKKPLYRHVIEKSMTWEGKSALGFVVGATHPKELGEIREYAPTNVFLIPGIGSQGGDIAATMQANGSGPAIVNVSRGIIYASTGHDFQEKAQQLTIYFQKEIGM
ncbi:MAG: orotidine-5'-phosphate decarboxylase [Ignavibacteria bacterium]|nr:orotidine-5'-phosphate decarboxylase [Ignavibacteria bacterium]